MYDTVNDMYYNATIDNMAVCVLANTYGTIYDVAVCWQLHRHDLRMWLCADRYRWYDLRCDCVLTITYGTIYECGSVLTITYGTIYDASMC